MKRSLKFSLRFANTEKKQKTNDLWLVYRNAVNYFILDDEISDEADYRDFEGDLNANFKQAALRQAQVILRADKNYDIVPELTKPCVVLNKNLFKIEPGHNGFDYWAEISALDKGHRITIPVKSYARANKYFKCWELLKGSRLVKDEGGDWQLQLILTTLNM